MTTTRIPEPGFAHPVQGAQQTFRALLDALSRPCTPRTVPTDVGAPGPLTPAAAAAVLTLCDDDTVLWLDRRLRDGSSEAEAWLRFHTGAPIADDPAGADFAIVVSPAGLPDLAVFGRGSDEAPHTSATVVVVDRDGAPGATFRADGPGFERPALWTAPAFPDGFAAQWAANHARFPRGVDLIVAGHHVVTGLPRTTSLTEVD